MAAHSAAMASHLDKVREANTISEKEAGFIAHFLTTTFPTPPAPIITIFLDIAF
jgi:hypothetical protein